MKLRLVGSKGRGANKNIYSNATRCSKWRNVMKKSFGILTALFVVLLIVGCSSYDNSENDTVDTNGDNEHEETNNDGAENNGGGDSGDEVANGGVDIDEIVVVTPAATYGWIAGAIYFAEEVGRELGFDNFRILTSSNIAEQDAQLNDLISQDVGAIVLLPHTYEIEEAAERVIDAGIPLVVFNHYLTVAYDAYVAGNDLLMGEEAAQKIGEGLNGEGIVVTVANPSAGLTSVVRNEGFAFVMGQHFPDIELIEMTIDNFTQEEALSSMADVLEENPQVDAVFSIDDNASLGILQAIRNVDRTDIQFISGGGGTQDYFKEIYIEDDITLFSTTYSPRLIGDAIRVAYRMLNGETISELDEANQWIIPPTIITRDNVASYFSEDSPY